MKKIQSREFVEKYLTELKSCLDALDRNKIEQAIKILLAAFKKGKSVFLLGNGGSASTASHMACDLGKGTLLRVYDEKESRFRVYSLTDNTAILTAFANDLSYEDIFVQQLRNLIKPQDVVIVLSGSGESTNVIKAVQYAKKSRAKTIGFLGFKTGGRLARMVDCAIIADSNFYGICEDIQLVLDHIIVSCLAKIKHIHEGAGGKKSHNKAVPFH